jgi:hypothetical protein
MICLTFDTDHMTDAWMKEFLGRFPIPGEATFFCHRSLESLIASRHELGPHPFIENLSSWQQDFRALAATLSRTVSGTRPHSCVFSHMVGVDLGKMGYTYVSQSNHIYQTGLRPYRHPWGLWELPIYYMDNMDFWIPKNWPTLGHEPFSPRIIDAALADPESLYVFDMHPLHIALNTRSHSDYEAVKVRVLQEGMSPFDLAVGGRGARVFFEELCDGMRRVSEGSYTCMEALRRFGCVRG